MKQNRSRWIALLLALCLLASALPLIALAEGSIQTKEDYEGAVERVQEALTAPDRPVPVAEGIKHELTRTYPVNGVESKANEGEITMGGANEFDLPVAGTLTLTAAETAEAYRWQVYVGGVWANIAGETGSSITLTCAMLQNALSSDDTAYVRCVLTRDGAEQTATAIVRVDRAYSLQPIGEGEEKIAVTTYYQETPVGRAKRLNSAAAQANPTTYTVIINYKFEDGKQAAPSWSASFATGSTYTAAITSPVVVGYAPDQAEVHVNATEAATINVIYKPALVEFTVKHYQQNVSNDNYTLVETETKDGYTESAVGENLAKTYDGLYALLYDGTTKIAADGSTVVKIYYDRYYYLMNFDLGGGYGVEPIYARYGAPISIGVDPIKPGYTFKGWVPSLPASMPAENTSYKAQWEAGLSGFAVVFWYENANDDGYSVAGTYQPADVTPGTQKSSGDYQNQNFTGRDDAHFTYNAEKAETVTVEGDGSSVLNVYFKRNTYTLTFKGGKTEITCGKEEHEHTHDGWYYKALDGTYYYGGCYPAGSYNGIGTGTGGAKSPTCGKKEHTHSNSCYKTSDLTITAKYGADIHGNFPIKDGDKTIWWTVPSGCQSFVPGNYLGSIDTMPGENITFTKHATESGAKIYYYVETLNGTAGDITYKGKNYKRYKVIDLEYDTGTSLTYAEEFHPITGFTQGDSNPTIPVGGKVKMKQNNYLYYTRNSYNLKFYNYNAYVDGKGGSVQFEAPLRGYNFTPDYPAELEANAYVFDGWYTTAGCYPGTEVDFETMTMPASDVVLYARWTAKTHTVKTYLTKDAMDKGEAPLNTWERVPHGTKLQNLSDPDNGNYSFVGWFYISGTGEERAYDPEIPINRDLNLYAKWSSNKLMEYTIYYQLANGTEIAPPTKGSALAGTTRTFNAKTGTQLNAGYQTGYYPRESSHSITMDIDGNEENKKNEFIFVYEPALEVTYTVRYLEKGTEKELADTKTVTTSKVIVTETFVAITGYAPDAYQKQLVLSVDAGKNVITFWYVKDDVHAPVQKIHWIQNIEGDGYTEYQSSTDLNGVIGNDYSETPLDIPGFKYNGTNSNSNGTLTKDGLVLNLYYDRIEYPFEFRFLEQGTDTVLADPVTGNARYQAQVTQTAKTIPGYTLVSAENQAINIAIEDPANVASKNVKTFYYTEQTVDIKYEVVGPTGCGTLDNYQESQLKVTTGEVKGSTPIVADGYTFVGWYTDEACKVPVNSDWVDNNNSKLTPDKTAKIGGTEEAPIMAYEGATYYAKFEAAVGSLTITKQGCNEALDEDQSFVFVVTNLTTFEAVTVTIKGNKSVTINDLPAGEYKVWEDKYWSWRYTPDDTNGQKTVKVEGGKNTKVPFNNTRTNGKWLDGNAYKSNKWSN